jgi:hypothetical protein
MKNKIAILLLALAGISAPLAARADVVWYEGFNYADGSLTNVSSGTWFKFSGTANPSDMYVTNKILQVTATGGALVSRQDDCARYLSITNNSIYTNTLQVLYASFTVICTNLPGGNGSYFASFYRNGTPGGFSGRIQALTNGTTLPNTWRLGVTGQTLATNAADGGYPLDLALNTPYQVVAEIDPITLAAATVWVNPLDFNQTGNTPTERHYTSGDSLGFATSASSTVNAFAFRQASSFGSAFFQITNLAFATTFIEAATNVWSTNAISPTIVYQPVAGVTNFTGASFILSAVANGQGLGSLTYQWQTNGVNVPNPSGNTNIFPFSSAATNQSSDYRLIVTTPYGKSATSSVAKVKISDAPVPPSFITQPVSQTAYRGQTVILSTTVSSPGNVSFTWYSNNVVVTAGVSSGGGSSSLQLDNVQTNFSASYKVAATNDVAVNGVVSSNAVLTVYNPAQVTIAYLRTLVDPVTYQATNVPPSVPYEVTGHVTTFTNITTGNTASYYLQDGTAGINIFVTYGSTFRPTQGDVVTFIGVLSSFGSGLELYANLVDAPYSTYTSYTVLSNDIAGLPAPIAIPYTILSDPNNANYNLGGSLVQISDVYFGTRAGTTTSATANDFVGVTNSAGQKFTLFFPFLDLDVAGQTLPTYAYTVTGVLYSFGGIVTNEIVVTRWADVVTTPSTPIQLSGSYASGSMTFTWSDASYALQDSTNVLGPYTTIPGATTGFVTNTTTHPTMFFRLYKP